ncbi:MAG: 50S ribosomal protein L18 [Patescibacteria group bacterium]
MDTKIKNKKKEARKKRVRAKITGTNDCPRLSVFRSTKHISLQLIDDENNKTLVYSDDKNTTEKMTKTEVAFRVGETFAKEATKKGFKKVIFDRGGCLYHGRVKAVAEGARKGGLEF